jgi:hypothetical protein
MKNEHELRVQREIGIRKRIVERLTSDQVSFTRLSEDKGFEYNPA